MYLLNPIRESESSQCEQAHLCVGRLRKEGEKVEDDWEGGKRNKRVGDALLLSHTLPMSLPKGYIENTRWSTSPFFPVINLKRYISVFAFACFVAPL